MTQRLARDQLRRAGAGNQHRSDHHVRFGQRFLDLERRRHDETDTARQDLVEVAHPVDRSFQNRYGRTKPERDHRRVVTDDAAPDHDDAARRDAGHPGEQEAAAAERLFEEVGTCLRGEAARDLAHRREQRERARIRLDRLVRHRRDPAVDERARERLVGGDVEICEEHESFAQAPVFGRHRFLHLEQEL